MMTRCDTSVGSRLEYPFSREGTSDLKQFFEALRGLHNNVYAGLRWIVHYIHNSSDLAHPICLYNRPLVKKNLG